MPHSSLSSAAEPPLGRGAAPVWCHPRRRDETGRHTHASSEAGPRRTHVRWEPTHGSPRDHPSCLPGSASAAGPREDMGTWDEDRNSCEHPLTLEVRSIGIGRGLAASPFPHHRTYGSRIRRFGRFSQGEIHPPTGASSPDVPAATSSQRTSLARPLAGCHLAAPQQATTLFYRSGLQRAGARLLCRLLTSAGRSGRIAPPSVLYQDTQQISRGKPLYRLCISARFIKHSPLWMEDFAVACQLVPTVPHLLSGSCPSPRTFAPRVLQTPPRGDALAFTCPSAPRTPGQGTFTPKHYGMHGTHALVNPRARRRRDRRVERRVGPV
jgi:hypothetical protein